MLKRAQKRASYVFMRITDDWENIVGARRATIVKNYTIAGSMSGQRFNQINYLGRY